VIDIVEILIHWNAGRKDAEVARSLGVDRGTVAKYGSPDTSVGALSRRSAAFVAPRPTVLGCRRTLRKWAPDRVGRCGRSWGQEPLPMGGSRGGRPLRTHGRSRRP
jgi:hypothetical protein